MKYLPLLCLALASGGLTLRADDYPRSWIDPDTGHRVVQLFTEPGSAGLYFTQYSFTAGGTKLLVMTPGGIDLVTVSTGETEHVYQGQDAYVVQTGRKTGAIFYAKEDGFLYALDPATRNSRQVGKFTAERLVNLSTHDYSIEPNGQFSPDGRWLVFRSNMHGPIQVYAVEVAKAN